VAVAHVFYAHCTHCGNLNLERASRDRVAHGTRLLLATLLNIPAYRCDHCRSRFFSVRPNKKIAPTRINAPQELETPASAETADAAEIAKR
jgi:DNA-directed RNA polymerase subunit RPC12/RpoP